MTRFQDAMREEGLIDDREPFQDAAGAWHDYRCQGDCFGCGGCGLPGAVCPYCMNSGNCPGCLRKASDA